MDGPGAPAAGGAAIRVDGVSKFFRRTKSSDPQAALLEASLTIGAGTFTCLVGPSGCGKSTLLNMIGGFLFPDQGSVTVDGRPIRGPGADRGMIFQEPTLFSWLTVRDNVLFGPKAQGRLSARTLAECDELLAVVGLQHFRDHCPHQLSGGMKQRLAIARALINRPGVLLMDEPFGALDAITRSHMQDFLLDLWTTHRTTIVFVTHDVEESVLLADRVVVMSPRPGRIAAVVDIDIARPRSTLAVDAPEQVAARRVVRSHLAGAEHHV
ncbi:ABC transporter ATP-binding protein [Labrys monachus]|uniref:NitT/TauT family transport system ATP-binding protein n=1 Tax=Labrys monachus TaxID=217067 RepID=A0ABU0FA94_9HYPH|nr:ABC transporter ATP-binding protein [Labrys monachus]MDQ0391538.1 NitT/TauT family transport system ATP-binding protein [Labrys monachus]